MKDIDAYISRYSLSQVPRVKKLSQPLLQFYGIDIFLVYRFTSDGFYSLLSNNPENTEYWHSQRFYETNNFCSTPHLFSPCKIIISSIQDEALQREKTSMKNRTNMDHECLVIKKPSPDIALGFCFASTIPQNKIHKLYSHTPSVFDQFIDYFLQESKDIRARCNENAVSILPYRGKNFYKATDCIKSLSHLDEQNRLFCKALQQKKDLLTPAERTCVELYLAGLTAEETAKELRRSKRTIEAHFEHIRNKLNIKSKRDLIRMYKKL